MYHRLRLSFDRAGCTLRLRCLRIKRIVLSDGYCQAVDLLCYADDLCLYRGPVLRGDENQFTLESSQQFYLVLFGPVQFEQLGDGCHAEISGR